MKIAGIILGLGLALISILAASGCSASYSGTSSVAAPAATDSNQVTYTDDIGRTVTIKGVPQRIVSLSPSNTEMVYALGLQDELVGITSYDNYPADVKSKTIVSDYSTLDMEKIVAARPDLVLADSIQKNTAIPALEKLGIPVVTVSPGSLDMIFNDLKMVGQVTGKSQAAGSLVSGLQARVKAVSDKTSRLSESQKPRVLYVTWHDPIWTAGSQTTIQELINLAGASNIASDLEGYVTITLEAAVQRNPQVILVMSSMGTGNQSLDFIKSNAQFGATDALKNNRVYEIDADIFGRTAPRIVDGLETLARLVHPELFK
jgi:iron complex transport system substrate-binding protein